MRSLICFLPVVSPSVADDWVGKKYMPRAEAKFIQGEGEVDPTTIPFPITVKAVDGDWLDVGSARVKKDQVVPLEKAAAYYTLYLLLHPREDWAYHYRGVANHINDQLDAAIRDYTRSIELDPNDNSTYNTRGVALKEKGDLDAALKDFDESIRLDSSIGFVFCNRGTTRESKGDIAGALKDYDRAIQLDPTDTKSYNIRGWILATTKDDQFRNPEKAVADATKASELSNWSDPAILDTLAAAFAAAGQFKLAIEYQEKAISLEKDDVTEYRSRFGLYREGKQYRE